MRQVGYRSAAALLGVIAVAVVASCSWVPFGGNKAEQPAAACPATVILHPLANTAVFNPGTAPADLKPITVAWYGIFSDISAKCQMAGTTLHASIDNVIVAERGPAARGNDTDFTYFVSLTGPDQAILGKKTFAAHVASPDKAKRGGINDHVEVAFFTGGRPLNDLSITVGFQQSPEAIEFYKNFRGR